MPKRKAKRCLMDRRTHGEEIAIIEARKSDLLSYIQTICRDHIRWSKRLLGEAFDADKD